MKLALASISLGESLHLDGLVSVEGTDLLGFIRFRLLVVEIVIGHDAEPLWHQGAGKDRVAKVVVVDRAKAVLVGLLQKLRQLLDLPSVDEFQPGRESWPSRTLNSEWRLSH